MEKLVKIRKQEYYQKNKSKIINKLEKSDKIEWK